MNTTTLKKLFAYDQWAHRQVWRCVETLTPEQFSQPHDYSIGSIRNLMHHMMETDWSMLRFLHPLPSYREEKQQIQSENFPDFASMRQHWEAIQTELDAYIATLTDADLLEAIDGKGFGWNGEVQRWEALESEFNHSLDHRAQVLALLHHLGAATVEQGHYFYLLELQEKQLV